MDLHAICLLQGSSSVVNHDGFNDDIPVTAHLDCYCEKLKGIRRLAWKIVDKILNRLYTQLQRFAVLGQFIPQSKTLMRIDKFHTQGTRNVQMVLQLLLNAIHHMDVLRFLSL
jgi:hypothetical protein